MLRASAYFLLSCLCTWLHRAALLDRKLMMVCRWLELVFNPRNNVERYTSQALRFIHPYLAFVTYRFHVEKSREIGKCRS